MLPTLAVSGNWNRVGASPNSGDGLASVLGGMPDRRWCEAFMGFPDEWCREAQKSKDWMRLLGNSVVPQCAEVVGLAIKGVLR